ncbi:MAG: invasion protein IalB [Gammaproteobacteria bacterium]|jgi:invasion protein IalB
MRHLNLLPLMLFAIVELTSISRTAMAEPADGESYGNWTINCESEAQGSREGCFIIQNLVLRDGGQRVLQIAIGYVVETPDPIALLSLPLGISLPPGAEIQIDSHAAHRIAIERCEPNGCRAGLRIEPNILSNLRTGKQISIKFYDAKRQPIEVPLSLDGFEQGLASLSASN